MSVILHPESDRYFIGDHALNGCHEVEAHTLPHGTRLPVAYGHSTVIADMDFEGYSEAGFIWDGTKWVTPKGATRKGLFAVGAVAYAQHPSAEVLSLAYDLKDGYGPRIWIPGMPNPVDLFVYIQNGGLIEAWNAIFEFWIWQFICVERMGWPPLPLVQLRDAMAKSRAFALPAKLEKAGEVLNTSIQKGKDGQRLINKFCIPRKPTKKITAMRILPIDDPPDALNLYRYNLGDIQTEAEIAAHIPDLSDEEQNLWYYTAAGNVRGMALDMTTVNAAAKILDDALLKYNAELNAITGGVVKKASEVQKLTGWLASRGVYSHALDSDAIDELLKQDIPPDARRAVQIRQLVGSAGVKKLYALQRMASREGRIHDLTVYHAARTGRDGGQDVQAQNLVKAGPKVYYCDSCQRYYGQHVPTCPYCSGLSNLDSGGKWKWQAVEDAVAAVRTGSLEHVEAVFGDAVLTLCGILRGLLVASDKMDLVSSDYSSIEAVVTAVLSGEQWRIDAFHRKEDIYLHSASRTTGIPFEEYVRYQEENGTKHPDRGDLGKYQELALGFGGWIGGWRQFDKSDRFTDDELKVIINTWRAASPAIVEFWGGQVRGKPWAPDSYELYGMEGAAIAAVQNPGTVYECRGFKYLMKDDALYCRLLSGRKLTYHRPRLAPSDRWDNQLSLSFEGYNSNPKMGPIGWIRIATYGGRLAQNVIQATARDIMMYNVPRIERAGYGILLRIHDELVTEVPEGFGSVEELEALMGVLPAWAEGWPVRAAGGWRGKRYRKD